MGLISSISSWGPRAAGAPHLQAGAQLTLERSGPLRPSPLTGALAGSGRPHPPSTECPCRTEEHSDQSAPTFTRVFGRVTTLAGTGYPGPSHGLAVRPSPLQMVLMGQEFPAAGRIARALRGAPSSWGSTECALGSPYSWELGALYSWGAALVVP